MDARIYFSRLVLGGNASHPRTVSRRPHGTLQGAKIGGSRLESGNLGIPGWVFRFPFVAAPICDGFAYLVFPIRLFGANGRPRGMSTGAPRNAARRENRGITTRMRKFRHSWMGLLFSFRRHPQLRWFRVFSDSALSVGSLVVMCAHRGRLPDPPTDRTERSGTVR